MLLEYMLITIIFKKVMQKAPCIEKYETHIVLV